MEAMLPVTSATLLSFHSHLPAYTRSLSPFLGRSNRLSWLPFLSGVLFSINASVMFHDAVFSLSVLPSLYFRASLDDAISFIKYNVLRQYSLLYGLADFSYKIN